MNEETGEGMTPVTLKRSQDICELPLSVPLDEAVWRAWLLKGRRQEERGDALRLEAVKWISLVGILLAAAAGVWSRLTPYDVAIRSLVAAGAAVLMSNAFHTRHYSFATMFGILAVLYNPVAPVFGFSGEWQRALVVASTIPFAALLTSRSAKLVPNE